MKMKSKEPGFTLIETVIVVFFITLLLLVLFNLYDWHSKIYNYQQALTRVSTSARTTLTTMDSYVSQSNLVLASASVNGTTYTSSANTLVLQLPSVDSSGNILAGKSDKAAFYPSGSNFYIQVEPNASSTRTRLNKILSDSLQSISLTYNDASFPQVTEVTVNFKAQLQVKSQTVTSNLLQNMYLLNY